MRNEKAIALLKEWLLERAKNTVNWYAGKMLYKSQEGE